MEKLCPNCSKELLPEESVECPYCGIFFEKWVARGKRESNVTSLNVSADNRKTLWVLLVIIVIVFFLILNNFIKRKTKDINPKDTRKLANLLALKAVGMDNTFQFLIKNFNRHFTVGDS